MPVRVNVDRNGNRRILGQHGPMKRLIEDKIDRKIAYLIIKVRVGLVYGPGALEGS